MRRHHLLGIALLVLAAGCAGIGSEDPSNGGSTTVDVSSTTTAGTETTSTTERPHHPSSRVTIEPEWKNEAEVDLSIRVLETETNRTVIDRSYDLSSGEEIDLTPELSWEKDYRVIVSTNGEERWSGTVFTNEGIIVVTQSDGTVRVQKVEV